MSSPPCDNATAGTPAHASVLDTRRVPVELLLLAGPTIAAMISRTVMSFVDFAMVSQLGTEAQAAIMPAGILLFVFIAFGMGVLSMVNTLVAQSLGRGRLSDCGAFAWQGCYIAAGFGLVALPLWPGVGALFTWVGHDPSVRDMEITYVRVGLLGVGPGLAAVALANFFNGIHRPGISLLAAVIANVVNAVANYALIWGHWGLPAMGIGGAAWGTNLASLVQVAISLSWMLKPAFARAYATRHTWRLDRDKAWAVVRHGLPAGAQHVTDIAAFAIFTLFLVGRFGTAQLAANNLAFKFLEVSFMPTVGLGVAVSSMVGKAIGQRRRDLARLATRWAAIFGIGYMGLIAVGYLTLRHEAIGLLTDDPEVREWAARLLLLCAVFQIFDAIGIIHISALRGAGDNQWPAIMSALCSGVVFLLGGWMMAKWVPQWGSLGPWTAATAYIIALGLVMWARWRHGPWERIELLDSVPATEPVTASPDARA